MNFDFTEDQHTIKRTAREFLGARFPPAEVRRLAGDERGFTDEQWSEMAGLGWAGIAVGEDAGGMGLGTVELIILAEELGYALAPSPLHSTLCAGQLLAAAGPSEALGAVAAGERRATVALWDEDQGWAPDEPTLRGSGSGTLTATKIAVPDAHAAELFVVAGAQGAHWLVQAGEGVEVEPTPTLDTTRKLSTVRLRDAPATPLEGDGFGRAWHVIAAATAAESVGVAQRAMEMAVQYARDRRQFGRPIGTNQAVSHACAQMLLETEGARSVVYNAGWALDFDPETAALAASMAKAYASDAGARVCRASMQVHGGIGFTWEHDLHFFLKRAEANAHAWGDSRWHRGRVAALVPF